MRRAEGNWIDGVLEIAASDVSASQTDVCLLSAGSTKYSRYIPGIAGVPGVFQGEPGHGSV